jgi:dTDP-4-amino-4,6-dideoxygalactose transaminase
VKVPFFDLKLQYQSIHKEVEGVLKDIFEEQGFILGPRVKEFEKKMASYLGVRNAVGVASGTDSLYLSLMALGVQPGDEVITTPFTFFATAGVISRLGATPVFVDIDPNTFLMNPSQVEEVMTPNAKAVIPVHLFGLMVDLKPLKVLSEEEELFIIEDVAQATGARDGSEMAGTVGTFGCFSFFPSKNLGGAGDGGLITTQSDSYGDLIRRLRVHGSAEGYFHTEVGINSRLDVLQAAILEIKLKFLEQWNKQRRENAERYAEMFQSAGLGEKISIPQVREGCTHVFNQYVIKTDQRDKLKTFLNDKEIGTAVYYPLPLHLQPCFKNLGYKEGDFPVSENAARTVLALPIFPELEVEQQAFIVETISEFFKKS